MDAELLAEARRAQERLIDAERDAEVARADFHRAVRRLHLNGASLRELAGGLGLSHQRVHQIVESAGGSRRWLRQRVPGQRVAGQREPGQPGKGRSRPSLLCTFCGRHQTQVSKLIAGPGVFICDGCAGLARTVIGSGEPARTQAGLISAVPADEQRVQCGFCGKRRHQVAGLALSTAGTERNTPATVCTECLDLCDEIIAEDPLPVIPEDPPGSQDFT